MSLKFGTSGLRGLSADLFGPASIAYPAAFGLYMIDCGKTRQGGTVLIGRDFRDSSDAIAKNVAIGLNAVGLVPVDCGALPTPALALYGMMHGAASIMITGSHIPADRNGLKFYRPDGEIDKKDEAGISAAATETLKRKWNAPEIEVRDESDAAMALFLERNRKILGDGALSGMRIGVYQHSTVARDLLVEVLRHYGADVVALGRSKTFIPVDTEAVSPETVTLTKGWTREYGLDSIVSADGDGDRPLVTDETGTPVKGDVLGLVCARFLSAKAVVTPVTSNSGLESAGDFRVLRTRVGSPYVIKGMETILAEGGKAVMGFEANGGTLTASRFDVAGGALDALPTRDSLLPVLALLASARQANQPVSRFCAGLALPVTDADRLKDFPLEKSD